MTGLLPPCPFQRRHVATPNPIGKELVETGPWTLNEYIYIYYLQNMFQQYLKGINAKNMNSYLGSKGPCLWCLGGPSSTLFCHVVGGSFVGISFPEASCLPPVLRISV